MAAPALPRPLPTADPAADPGPRGRPVRSLVVLGDSTAVGLGDPLPGGGWRGVGPLLADALGVRRYTNLSCTGARVGCLRRSQLPGALALRPDVALLVVGMNDTLRADFDAPLLAEGLDDVVGSLRSAGAQVLTLRLHDHSRVFRLPGPLRRALQRRVTELNGVLDEVVRRHGALPLDAHLLPGAYDATAWSVDRLHPSERGHRLLAGGFAQLLAADGWSVPSPVAVGCSGGRPCTAVDRAAWLVLRGVPWLARRGRDLVPHAAALVVRDVVARAAGGSVLGRGR